LFTNKICMIDVYYICTFFEILSFLCKNHREQGRGVKCFTSLIGLVVRENY
jgi:hypothetical protein